MRRSATAILCCACLPLLAACSQSAGGAGYAPNTPAAPHVILPPMRSPSPLYHPIDRVIDNAAAVQRLYAAAVTQPVMPRGKMINCPAEFSGDPA